MKKEPSPAFIAAREMAKRLAAMTDEERAAIAPGFQPTTIEGHPLSLKNTMLLAMQRPAATIVGGFQQWKKAGRIVRKGQAANWIYAPNAYTNEEGEDKLAFRLVPIFDIGQTEQLEGPQAQRQEELAA